MSEWLVARLKPGGGSLAVVNLTRQGYAPFYPMLRGERLIRGRVSPILTPLFPGYLFVDARHLPTVSWSPIINTRGVASLLMSGSSPARVADDLIREIKSRERNGAIDSVVPPRWRKGDKVALDGGQFAGHVGLYNGRATGREREIVLLEILGRLTRVEVHASDIR